MGKSFDRDSYGSGRKSRKALQGSTTAPRSLPEGRGAGSIASTNPYSRDSLEHNYSKQRKRKKRRKILTASLIAVLVLFVGAAGAAYAYISDIQGNLQSDVDEKLLDVLEKTDAGEPFYMLLLGTDGSQERDESGKYSAYRTDSIMLVRIDPQEQTVTVVSLLRDTMVDMDDYGMQKLNAAYALGGASYAVEVASELAGVPISHYAEVNFDGFADIVDALGGIEVDVPVEIDDEDAGGHLDAGLQTLNGEQALILCRSRHTYDDIGKGDEYRAANQRTVIKAIIEKVLDSDISTMMSTVQTLSNYVTTDLSVTEILSLANSMRGIDLDSSFYSATNPTVSEYIDGVWWEVMEEDAWEEMMERVDAGLSPTEDEEVDETTGIVMASGDASSSSSSSSSTSTTVTRSGTVSIRNGTNITGAAAEAQELIDEMGYTTDTGNADNTAYEKTIVVYEDDDQAEYAQEIADALGTGEIVQNEGNYLYSTDFLVVIGADWESD